MADSVLKNHNERGRENERTKKGAKGGLKKRGKIGKTADQKNSSLREARRTDLFRQIRKEELREADYRKRKKKEAAKTIKADAFWQVLSSQRVGG